jgi:hypothetical protein
VQALLTLEKDVLFLEEAVSRIQNENPSNLLSFSDSFTEVKQVFTKI